MHGPSMVAPGCFVDSPYPDWGEGYQRSNPPFDAVPY